jgi:hypothetical protein
MGLLASGVVYAQSGADVLVSKLKEGKNHPKIPASDAELKAAVKQVLSTK